MGIIKTPEQIEQMRVAGRLAAEVLQMIGPHVKPGVTTEELDRICHDHIVKVQGAIPANVGYKGFPDDLHLGQQRHLPRHSQPAEGAEGRRHRQHRCHRDQGWLARRHQPHVLRGQPSRYWRGAWSRSPARRCGAASAAVRPGATLGDIGHAIQSFAEAERFSVVREYCGHGIGRSTTKIRRCCTTASPANRPDSSSSRA
jgi:methionyl aminopeptidase